MKLQNPGRSGKLRYRETVVAGRPVRYLYGGHGPSVVFLHGWGLANRTYERALSAVVARGARVYAPTMPGFGGSEKLGGDQIGLADYAEWVGRFIRAVRSPTPMILVGHSFGGGVAIRVAHDFPALVEKLVLVNSIGGSAWTDGKGVLTAMRERPLWDWGLHLQADLWPSRQMTRVLPVILRDALHGLLRDPGALWRAGKLARTADLTEELGELRRRQLPVTIVWSSSDDVVPATAIASLREAAVDAISVTVPGRHGWLLADPRGFGDLISSVLAVADAPVPLANRPRQAATA